MRMLHRHRRRSQTPLPLAAGQAGTGRLRCRRETPRFQPFGHGNPSLAVAAYRQPGLNNSDPVSRIDGYEGRGLYLYQSASARPTFTTGVLGGYPGLTFVTASSQFLYMLSALTFSGPFTIATVTKLTATANTDRLAGSVTPLTSYLQFHSSTTTRLAISGGGVPVFTHAARGTGGRVDVWHRNSANTVRHWLNGVESTGSTTSAGDLVLGVLGAGNASVSLSNFFGGSVLDFVCLPVAIASPAQMAAELMAQYGL